MTTIELSPNVYTAAYSNIPIVVSSDNSQLEKFKYVVNVCYDSMTVADMEAYTTNGEIFTKLEITAHPYKLGDTLLIYDGQYVGYYTVIRVVDDNHIVIDLTLGAAYNPMSLVSKICRYYRYKLSPDPDGLLKIDIANTIKDFVSANFVDGVNIYDGSSTRFDYFLVVGEEYKFSVRFVDNGFFGGNVSFYNPAITSLTDIPFQTGDRILVQQDLFEWVYTDNFFSTTPASSGRLGFTSTNVHNWEVGDVVTVTGQVTQPAYNGPAAVFEVIDNMNIVVDKQFTTSTPTEGGSIFGVPVPSYNADTRILNIYIDPTYGLVIETDFASGGATQPIPGTITYLDNVITQNINIDVIDDLYAYNALQYYADKFQASRYSKTYFNSFIPGASNAKFSTIHSLYDILNVTNDPKLIEVDTKAFLLMHKQDANNPNLVDLKYDFYSSYENMLSNTILGTSLLPNEIDSEDIYAPIGIQQLIDNTDRVDVGGFDLETDYVDVKYYRVSGRISTTVKWDPIYYKVNDDCAPTNQRFSLLWKDALGSWVSYPFKYAATQTTETVRSDYYQREGNFIEGDGWGFDLKSSDRGDKGFFSRSRDKFALTSGWVNERENYIFADLIKSTEVYLQIHHDNNVIVPVKLTTNSIEYGRDGVDQVFNYSPTVQIAYNEIRY